MKRIFAVCAKELKRFFTDIRMIFSLVIPGIVIFIIYTFMGDFFSQAIGQIDTSYQFKIVLTNNYNTSESENKKSLLETTFEPTFESLGYKDQVYTYIDVSEIDNYKTKLKNKEIDLLVIYDDNFENDIFTPSVTKPNINILYNSEIKESEFLFQTITQTIGLIYSNYTVNGNIENPNVGTQSMMALQVMGIIIPMLTMSILYSTTLVTCPESIAGEKERGTLSSILITPIKRYEFALGKILALTIVSLFGGIVSGAGILFSLPKLFSGVGNVDISIGSYVMVFLVLISVMLLFINIATTISTFAKTTKEATSYLGPFNVILMIASLIPAFLDCTNIGFAFLPIVNVSQTIMGILNGNLDILYLSLTFVSNIVFSGLLVLLDIKLFNTESIVMRQ